jgi:hypothetical protein
VADSSSRKVTPFIGKGIVWVATEVAIPPALSSRRRRKGQWGHGTRSGRGATTIWCWRITRSLCGVSIGEVIEASSTSPIDQIDGRHCAGVVVEEQLEAREPGGRAGEPAMEARVSQGRVGERESTSR